MWRNLERLITCLIMTVDHHIKAGYVAQSHFLMNHFKMI